MEGLFAGLGLIYILFALAFVLFLLVSCIKGLIMAFRASIVLGIICLFLEFPFPLFAWCYWFGGIDLAQRIVKALPEVFAR